MQLKVNQDIGFVVVTTNFDIGVPDRLPSFESGI